MSGDAAATPGVAAEVHLDGQVAPSAWSVLPEGGASAVLEREIRRGRQPRRAAAQGDGGHPTLPVDELATVSLDDLAGVAQLRQRYDAKYVVAAGDLPRLIAAVSPRMRVLDVDGRRCTDYVSVYFDTPDLLTYREHVMGRRRRFKVRTRHYGDPDAALLELKLKGNRGQTVKYRWPHESRPDELDAVGHARAAAALLEQYGTELPRQLRPVISTAYRRTTLVDLDAGERLTIDEDLTIRSQDHERWLGRDVAVVEAKATALRGLGVRALGQLGLRPDRISKYCLAVAASYEDVRGNPWLPVLRRLGGEEDAPSGT